MGVNMEQNNRNYEDIEIDLSQCIKVIVKRKKTLIVVFLLTFAIGLTNILFSPKIYRISMMIQPPVAGPSLTGADDLELAENLKGLIINGAYNEEIKKRLNMDLDKDHLDFKAIIPSKTNIIKVSVDLESKKKDFGIVLLRNLINVISDSYAKSVEARGNDIANQISLNERAILNAKEKANNLQVQIKEMNAREDKLMEEIKAININTEQVLEKRKKSFENNQAVESAATLLLANYIQNNSSYLNHVNNQYSEISIRKANFALELKNIDTQINNLQMEIDKLNIRRSFISNLKIIAQPRVFPDPVNSDKKKNFALLIFISSFLGMVAVFLHEFCAVKLVKK